MLPAVAQCGSCALNVQTNRTHDLGPTAIRSRSGRYYGSSSHRGAGDSQPRAGLCRLVAPPVQQPQRQGSARMRRPPQAQSTAEESTKTSVLFVCLGNICRSPTAEAVFNSVVQKAGRADSYVVDSCGTGGGNPSWYQKGGWSYHEGDPSDPRMLEAAKRRGVHLTSRSRPLTPEDFLKFDYIVGMDDDNLRAIKTAAEYWRSNGFEVPASYHEKVKLMTDSLRSSEFSSYAKVPDPYFGGAKGFDLVLDLLEDACEGLLEDIEG